MRHRVGAAIQFRFATLPTEAHAPSSLLYARLSTTAGRMRCARNFRTRSIPSRLCSRKEAATEASTQLQANALGYFNPFYADPTTQNISINASYTTGSGSKVVVAGT